MSCRTVVRTGCLAVSGMIAFAAVAAPVHAQEGGQAAGTADTEAAGTALEVITVTATKRPERLRDISGSVTAFNEEGLEALGAETLADYLTRTPGVVFNQTVPGNSAAIVRGVATTTGIAQAQGTTGYFINDVPLTDPFYSSGIPDIDTFDVGNVAILRGPQGTLFGSASLGGAINYQAESPDLDAFDLHFRGTTETTRHGGDGYNGHIMLNAPVVPGRFAVRGVFGHRRDAGYVDNVGTGERHSNRSTVNGGRLLATFAPMEGTTINYLFLEQTQRTHDAGSSEPAIGAYEKSTQVSEPFRYKTTIHNLRLDQDLAFATLTATATRHEKRFSGQQDYSGLVPAFAPAVFLEPGTSKGNTFEARIASLLPGSPFEYLAGLFYDTTREAVINQLVAPNAAPIFGTDMLLDATVRIHGRERAAFGEASYHFTDQFKVTVGGRYFETELNTVTEQEGPLVGGATTTTGNSSETGFSPKASLTWQPNDQYLFYALVSKGFRFGGPNIATDPSFAIPKEFDSDSLVNYEIGARTTWLDRKVQLDGTLFYVDWDDIQVSLRSPGGLIYTANAGKARNMGVETTAVIRPDPDWTLQSSVTYLDAELRRDFGSGPALVPEGSTLPGASKWQLANALIYSPLDIAYAPTFVLSYRRISSAPGELTPVPAQQGGYNLFDLRIGATFGRFGITAFAENIGDVRGITQASTGVRGQTEYLVRPRTFGLTLDYRL